MGKYILIIFIILIIIGIIILIAQFVEKKKKARCRCGYRHGGICSESLYRIEVDESIRAFTKTSFIGTFCFRCPKCKNEQTLDFNLGDDYYEVPKRAKEIAVDTLGFSQYSVIPTPTLKIKIE